jgi:hypothetical protein
MLYSQLERQGRVYLVARTWSTTAISWITRRLYRQRMRGGRSCFVLGLGLGCVEVMGAAGVLFPSRVKEGWLEAKTVNTSPTG